MEKHKQYEKFMLESNTIEGEKRLNPGDIAAVRCALALPKIGKEELCHLHILLGEYLKKDWVGKFRTVNVHVGRFCPVDCRQLDLAMEAYFQEFPFLDSWEAHNKFEVIHPFQDLNGRVGRLIWLMKAIKEGYNFRLSFLRAYYYQTLYRYEMGKGLVTDKL
jgi:fido (protein-threonine AMPylation protein)